MTQETPISQMREKAIPTRVAGFSIIMALSLYAFFEQQNYMISVLLLNMACFVLFLPFVDIGENQPSLEEER